jgi:8-oxo-dGTP pyrophosphatase MutT (NUDIX family)
MAEVEFVTAWRQTSEISLRRDKLLQAYLDLHPAHHETTERWPIKGEMRVRLSLATTLPPAQVSSSVLSIVLDAHQRVLYLWPTERSGSIHQALIGGRPNAGETPEQTVVREVGEETGWLVEPIRMIGFRHFVHIEPWSNESDRPYPDFIQPIFVSRAVRFEPERAIPEDRIPAEFIGFEQAERATDSAQRPLLRAAKLAFVERLAR